MRKIKNFDNVTQFFITCWIRLTGIKEDDLELKPSRLFEPASSMLVTDVVEIFIELLNISHQHRY